MSINSFYYQFVLINLFLSSIYLFTIQSTIHPSRVPVQATNRLWQRVDYGMLSVDIYTSLPHFNRSYLDTPIILNCYEICWTYKKNFSSFSYQCWKVWTYVHMYIHTCIHTYNVIHTGSTMSSSIGHHMINMLLECENHVKALVTFYTIFIKLADVTTSNAFKVNSSYCS